MEDASTVHMLTIPPEWINLQTSCTLDKNKAERTHWIALCTPKILPYAQVAAWDNLLSTVGLSPRKQM